MNVREVVERYYATVNAGDWDSWLELFDAHLVMDEQLGGHIEGIETLRGIVGGLKRVYASFQNTPRYIVIDGNQASVVSHITAVSARGVPIQAEVANYFLIQEGRIVYMANFHDSRPFDPAFKPGPERAGGEGA
ncbi:nuclear transport factor 2 family protein [Archangium sp.]|jgi:ketosteroid isomerase-like protein|uniref:nuclear transport factor 2 family protein n=1 Tax=Archangium sp. TaxID=1872627 RepID=UPI002ED838C7